MNLGQAIDELLKNKNNKYQSNYQQFNLILKMRFNKIFVCEKGNEDKVFNIADLVVDREWTRIPEAVTFMEAINSGKRIMSEHTWGYTTIHCVFNDLACCNIETSIKYINGKWYIEN